MAESARGVREGQRKRGREGCTDTRTGAERGQKKGQEAEWGRRGHREECRKERGVRKKG